MEAKSYIIILAIPLVVARESRLWSCDQVSNLPALDCTHSEVGKKKPIAL